MAYDYNKYKSVYEGLNDDQRQKWDAKYGNTDQYKQFKADYEKETNSNQQSNNNSSNFNNQNGTNGQNQTNFETPTVQKTESQNNNQTYNYDPNEKLDTSMFGASDGKVKVQEGTAQQTGMPDYQLDSDARTREITDNLNAYWQTNREYFQDRNTYNNMFHYNERSDQQKAVLDSYWKKKEDMNVAEKYNTADGIKSGMNDAEITPDQLNYIKEYSPEAYKEWQQKQLDDINLRIANLATPADPTDNAELFNSLLTKLGLEPGDPYQIYDNWYNMAERLGVFSDSEKLKSYQNQLDANHSKMESIMSRYAASTGGTVSDSLAAARMQKALAPYQQREVDLQNSYTTLLNGRNSNLAIANQSAQALAMQAQEDQRIWNQRLQGLGFAMNTASYRSPEQQAQLKLQTASIQNDMNLLQTSMQNDLNRYNAYATAKMQNQLQQELTDLSVEDEAQLKANLNNALSDYYKNYGDIIQRSQAQAVDDIIAYAKKKGISVAQAMTENFIKPLQNKAEYKQKVATDYGMLSKQSIGTINGRSVIMTQNPNGSISYQYIDSGITDSYTIDGVDYVVYNGQQMTAKEFNEKYGNTVGTVKPYDMVDSKVFDTTPVSHSYYTLSDFLIDPKTQVGKKGGQCAKFVNDYLEKIGVGRYFGNEDIKTRQQWVNSDSAKVGTVAIFDYNHTSSDGINHGHVGIVVDTDENGFWVLDSNGDLKNPGVINKRYVRYGSSSCKGFFDPSQPPRVSSDTQAIGGLSSSQLNSLAEDYINGTKSYSDIKSTYGDKVLNAVGLRASQLTESGYEKSKIITDPSKILSAEQSLMSKFSSMNKGNQEALTQINKMQQALDTISADKKNNKKSLNAASQTIVTAFNKILDPTSVVRESEYARTPEGQSYLERLQGKYEQLTKGGAGLTYENLQAAVNLANEFASSYQENQNQLAQLIRNQAKTYGLNESNILPLDVIETLDNPKSSMSATGPTNDIQKYFDGLYSTVQGNTGNVTANAMYSKVDFILKG